MQFQPAAQPTSIQWDSLQETFLKVLASIEVWRKYFRLPV